MVHLLCFFIHLNKNQLCELEAELVVTLLAVLSLAISKVITLEQSRLRSVCKIANVPEGAMLESFSPSSKVLSLVFFLKIRNTIPRIFCAVLSVCKQMLIVVGFPP